MTAPSVFYPSLQAYLCSYNNAYSSQWSKSEGNTNHGFVTELLWDLLQLIPLSGPVSNLFFLSSFYLLICTSGFWFLFEQCLVPFGPDAGWGSYKLL